MSDDTEMRGNGGGGSKRRSSKKGDRSTACCPGIGHPQPCPKGCCSKSCKSWWIGDNPILFAFWAFMFYTGMPLYFITRFVFYPMWSLNQIPGATSFMFTHLGWPANNFYGEWMPSLALAGAFELWMCAGIVFIGGVHIPGFMMLLGTTGLTISAIEDLYAGTAASRFSMTTIIQSQWWFLASLGTIFLGLAFSVATGLRPLPNDSFGCRAQWCRIKGNIKNAMPKKSEKTGGFGRPCGCPDGCVGCGCKTTWIGDNDWLRWIAGIVMCIGFVLYALGQVFYSMYSVRQFDPADGSFGFTHQSWPSEGYLVNPFVEYMLIIGTGMLVVFSLIVFIGGLHLPGLFWFLGTGALVSSYSMQFVYGTTGDGNITNLEISMWVNLAGVCSVLVGFIMCLFTGMTPNGMSWESVKEASRRAKKLKPPETDEIVDEDDDDEEH